MKIARYLLRTFDRVLSPLLLTLIFWAIISGYQLPTVAKLDFSRFVSWFQRTPSAPKTTDFTSPSVSQWSYLVEDAAARYNVPGEFIYGVMTVESLGDPNAISYAGASGLMQIMPQYVGADYCPQADLFDPEQNVDCAVRAIRDLMIRYDGDLYMTAMAYHGGAGNADMGGRPVDRQYAADVLAASVSPFNGRNIIDVLYGDGNWERTGTKGLHDNGALDYRSLDNPRLYAPISGVAQVGVDGLGNTYIRITGDNGESVLLMHGRYTIRHGEPVRRGQYIGEEDSIGNSTHPHSHVQHLIAGIPQPLP